MRKSVILLAIFVFLNLLFSTVVSSEGIKIAEVVSNTSVPPVTSPAAALIENKVEVPVSSAATAPASTPAPAAPEASAAISQAEAAVKEEVTESVKVAEVQKQQTLSNQKKVSLIQPKVDVYAATVKLSYNSEKRMKVLVEKGGIRYQYNLRNDGTSEYFPLQLGNGDYKVSILENKEGTKYTYVNTQIVSLQLSDSKDAFLNSNQQINWSYDSNAALKAAELVLGIDESERKIRAIYNYVIDSLVYDYDKFNTLESTYLPEIDSILSSGKAICFDYSSLFAAMLRSVGIEAKLIKGYTENVNGYHAWNEVYDQASGNWMVIDTTYDSMLKKGGYEVNMIKDSSIYAKKLEF